MYSRFVKKLLSKLVEKLDERFEQFFTVEPEGQQAAIAAFVNPLFKRKWVKCLDKSLGDKIRRIVLDSMMNYQDFASQESSSSAPQDDFFQF